MSIEKLIQKLSSVVSTATANGKRAVNKAADVTTSVQKSGKEILDKMDAASQSAKAAVRKTEYIDSNKSCTKQLMDHTVKKELKRDMSELEILQLAKESENGAKEVLYATKRQDISKSAEGSASVFIENGKSDEERIADLTEKYGAKLEAINTAREKACEYDILEHRYMSKARSCDEMLLSCNKAEIATLRQQRNDFFNKAREANKSRIETSRWVANKKNHLAAITKERQGLINKALDRVNAPFK